MFLDITRSMFSANSHAFGGALYIDQYTLTTQVSIVNTSFANNSAKYGGVLYTARDVKDFNITVIGCNITNNTATESSPSAGDGGSGGGFYFPMTGASDYSCYFDSNSFINNEARAEISTLGITGAGGGIFYQPTDNAGNCIISRNLFQGNKANFGAGMLFKRGDALATIGNVFRDNYATINGGAAAIMKVSHDDQDSIYQSTPSSRLSSSTCSSR